MTGLGGSHDAKSTLAEEDLIVEFRRDGGFSYTVKVNSSEQGLSGERHQDCGQVITSRQGSDALRANLTAEVALALV